MGRGYTFCRSPLRRASRMPQERIELKAIDAPTTRRDQELVIQEQLAQEDKYVEQLTSILKGIRKTEEQLGMNEQSWEAQVDAVRDELQESSPENSDAIRKTEDHRNMNEQSWEARMDAVLDERQKDSQENSDATRKTDGQRSTNGAWNWRPRGRRMRHGQRRWCGLR